MPKPQPQPLPPAPRELPLYSKSLLKIKVPIVVTLAEKKQQLSQIVEMGPGMIIQFEKSCEEMLELEIGHRKIAAGEAIKVGDKFGIRVTSIILPEERFKTVKPRNDVAMKR
jgi:flagellar motor switch/type III secretory pathway protein FliN